MRVFGDELRASGAKVQSLGNRFPLTLGPPLLHFSFEHPETALT